MEQTRHIKDTKYKETASESVFRAGSVKAQSWCKKARRAKTWVDIWFFLLKDASPNTSHAVIHRSAIAISMTVFTILVHGLFQWKCIGPERIY